MTTTDGTARTLPDQERDHIRSIERGFAVLLAFDAERTNPTLAELADATGLSRPAVRRILLTLQRLGYVRGNGGRWALTPRVLTIGQHYVESHALVETAQPYLLDLAERTHESASLASLDGTEVVYVARVPVRRIMSINVAVGTRVPAHATSMGRVLLAWLPEHELDAYLAEAHLGRFTAGTVAAPDALRAVLADVREAGFALVDQELEQGLLSASAPVRDRSGAVVAALATSTSTGRSDVTQLRENVVPLLLEVAASLSDDLGYRPARS